MNKNIFCVTKKPMKIKFASSLQIVLHIYKSKLKNTIFSLPLLAEHFHVEMKEANKKTALLVHISLDFKKGCSYSAVLVQYVRAKRDEASCGETQKIKHSGNYKVWKLTEFSLRLLTELIGVEPSFSGCFCRQ